MKGYFQINFISSILTHPPDFKIAIIPLIGQALSGLRQADLMLYDWRITEFIA